MSDGGLAPETAGAGPAPVPPLVAPLVAPPPAHPAARRVAEHAHAALARRAGPAAAPDVALVAATLDVAFWASLRREEGASPRVSLAFLPPARAAEPLRFRRRLPLAAAPLARLAPAVERPGIHLGVWRGAAAAPAAPALWGTTRHVPPFTLVLEVAAPGVLVLKYRPADGGKFVNLVVVEGDAAKVVEPGDGHDPDCPAPLARQFGLGPDGAPWATVAELLVELAVSMRAHGRGGTLLVVPEGSDAWRESVARANPYRVRAAAPVLGADGTAAAEAVEAVAGLTAVDGATVLTTAGRVAAFGAKIVRRRGRPQVRRAELSAPVAGDVPSLVPLGQLGATRHLSAAQFVADQPDALALVASQDGHFTVFRAHEARATVRARRVETLLI